MKLLRIVCVFMCAALSGACSVLATNRLDLTVLNSETALPEQNHPIRVRLPKWYGNPSVPSDDRNVSFYELDLKTDENGRVQSNISLWYAYGGLWEQMKGVKKPMFFVNTPETGDKCSLILWYLEDEKAFVPLKFENGEIKPLEHIEDVTGDFSRHADERGWDVQAVIRKPNRICSAK